MGISFWHMKQLDFSKFKKIVITGGAGFLGSFVQQELTKHGADPKSFFIPRSQSHDLRDFSTALKVVEGAQLVIHLAARVGGIGFNQKYPGELFYDNIAMGTNIIESSRLTGVEKIVVAGTICAYPSITSVPFREENLWNGYPEITNAPYGIAKKALSVMIEAYQQQYGLNGIYLLPVNLYGPRDNFDRENSHVIPAMIRKFIEAKETKSPSVTLWGDGTPTREFLYVEEAARAIVLATRMYNSTAPVNLGSSDEISIKDLADIIRKKVAYSGEICWDKSRPGGQERRKLDTSRAYNQFGFKSNVHLDEGLDRTIQWWMKHRTYSPMEE